MSIIEKKHHQLRLLTAYSMFAAVLIGVSSNFVKNENIQHLCWAFNSFFIIVGSTLIGLKLTKEDHDIPAAGFVILSVGNALSYGFVATHDIGSEQFGASIFIYAPALVLIGLSDIAPLILRIFAFISAIAFCILAISVYFNANSEMLQPILIPAGYFPMTIVEAAWAWWILKGKI